MSAPHESVEAFADQYFDRLVQWGEQTLTQDPLVSLEAPGSGNVLWRDGDQLSGYEVGTLFADSPLISHEDFAAIGFDAESLKDGLWVLKNKNAHIADGRLIEQSEGHTFAHYDGTSWHVVRLRDNVPSKVSWIEQWAEPTSELSDGEKNAIGRIAEASEFVRDAAFVMQDDTIAYSALKHIIQVRAQTAGGSAPQNIAAVEDCWGMTIPPHLAARFGHPASQLSNLARPLYLALAGRSQESSGSVVAVNSLFTRPVVGVDNGDMDIRESLLYPPFEAEIK